VRRKRSNMTPLDLKTKEKWEEILNRFAKDAKMTACLTDDTGKQLICAAERFPLCSAVRETPGALMSICSQTNSAMLAVVKKTLKPEVDVCEAGLIRVVVPVVQDGSLVGQVTACGLASKDEELNSFFVAKEVAITEDQVLELAKSTPLGSEEELTTLCAKLFEELK
jgi:ligand-binding sensor protein